MLLFILWKKKCYSWSQFARVSGVEMTVTFCPLYGIGVSVYFGGKYKNFLPL